MTPRLDLRPGMRELLIYDWLAGVFDRDGLTEGLHQVADLASILDRLDREMLRIVLMPYVRTALVRFEWGREGEPTWDQHSPELVATVSRELRPLAELLLDVALGLPASRRREPLVSPKRLKRETIPGR